MASNAKLDVQVLDHVASEMRSLPPLDDTSPGAMQAVMAHLEAAERAAGAVEGRLDGLLQELDTMLSSLEDSQPLKVNSSDEEKHH